MGVFFGLFAAACVTLVGVTIVRPRLVYEYPYFMAAAFTAFVLPQAYAVYRNEWGGIYGQTTLLMCFLCLACCWLGYQRRPHPALLQKFNFSIDARRFLVGGIALVLIGSYFTHKFATLQEEELAVTDPSGQLSGIGTVYLFFGGLVYPGFAICFYCALKERWLIAWLAAIGAAVIPMQAALFYGRREPSVLFLMAVGLGLFFTKGKTAPRWTIIVAIMAAMFFIPATSEYRQMAREDPLAALKEIDFSQQFQESLAPEATSELKNATALIAATETTGSYGLGAGYWNELIFRFVPAQFVSKEFKSSLMIGGEHTDLADFVEQTLEIRLPPGTTVTGIGDSFNQFGYFGCLFFAAVGYLFKTLWAAANRPNGTIAQILYVQITTSAMRAATHQTLDFLPGFIYALIFIGGIAWFAKKGTGAAAPLRQAPAGAQLLSR
ncbi:MAG TPA: hypothetical protein VFO22_03035 [Candidatus Udaeobacter sp.]|nr:hypothetical protein [Candidatus Udaeobacter sp.]